MPLALLTVHATCRADTVRGAARASLGLALVIAIQTLAGHPQFVYYSALLVAAFAIERVWNARRPWRLAWCASGALLGVAMSAAIAWPMVLYGAASVRGTGAGVLAEEAMRYALAPRDFLTFGWPAAMGFAGGTYWGGMSATDYPVYFGVLVTGLCLALPFSGLARREGPTRLLLGVALLATLLTLGVRLGAVDAFLRAVVPLWSRFRTPVAVVIVAQLAAVLISARALTGLLAAVSAGRSKLLVVLAAAGLLLAAGLATMHEPFESSYAATAMAARAGFQEDAAHAAANAARGDLAAVLVIAALAAALLALRGRLPKATAFAVAGMLLIAAFDLGRVSVLFMHLSSAPRSALAASPLPPIARLAADEPLFRVSTATYDSLVLHNQWIPWRARSIGGGHGVPPLLWAQVASSGLLQRASALRAMSVRYVVVPPGARPDESDFERVTATDSAATIWRVRSALPRAYAVPAVRAPGNDMAVMSAMASLDSFPERVAFASDPAAAGDYPGSRDASIRWLEDAPDRLKLEVDAPERAFVVVADAWFEGWTARLDDRAIPIRRINHLLRGVAVEAGRHILTFDYVPAGWREGVATTRLCGALWLVLLAATLLPVPPRRLQTTQALGPGRE